MLKKFWSRAAGKPKQPTKPAQHSLGLPKLFSRTAKTSLAEQLEETLLRADFGVSMTEKIIRQWRSKADGVTDDHQAIALLRSILSERLEHRHQPLVIGEQRPFCLMVVGSNGVGKTTSLAKIAYFYKQQGYKLRLVAGDTIRAAAVDQLRQWGERLEIAVSYGKPQADSAAVIYDGIQDAMEHHQDMVLVDTAGFMTTADELTDYTRKVINSIQKLDSSAPHEILLVLDATHGQSALRQAQGFCERLSINGLCLTKLDSSAKGGIVFALTDELELPIRFIGVGEKQTDLHVFDPDWFLDQLLEA